MDTAFVKLPPCGGKTYYLLTQLKDEGKEGFQLMLTDGDKFWDGQITEEDLDALSSNLKMDFTTYVKKTVAAFTRRNMEKMRFAYQLKPQADGVADFLWKEEVGDIKIVMGSATLHLQEKGGGSVKALMSVFSSCINMAGDLQHRIHTLEADNQRLAQERHNALERLKKCTSAKEKLEQDLYSKFAAVLNSKKEKIRNLQAGRGDTMDDAAEDPVASTSGEAASGSKRGRGKASAMDSTPTQDHSVPAHSSEEGDGQDTDDETPPTKWRAPVRKGALDDADSSLNLGDDDDGTKTQRGKQVVRRPARQRGGNKRQTPSRPVLPKVSSKSSDVGAKTPQRRNLRKSGSGNSDQSMGNVDTDDLINDF